MDAFAGIEEAGLGTQSGPVSSLDFRRIVALPRRDWTEADDLVDLTAGLTDKLKRPAGRMALKVNQAAALRDLHDFGGLFGPIAVGGGKTLITLLAPVVMGAQRPVLLVPAALREQTIHHVLPKMRDHWVLHPRLKVLGYSELSLAKNADLLERLGPDMIIADECHMLKNPRSGRTRRVSRYMKLHPWTQFIGVSGTVSNHSIMHYWHIIQWALKPDNAPVPRSYNEAREWALAIDERVRDDERTGPGALMQLAPEDPGTPPHLRARRGFRLRLVRTPGVIATSEEKLGVSLQLLKRHPQKPMSAELRRVLRQTSALWETPSGEVIMEAVGLWRILRELACGFYYRWNPAPPKEWMAARKEWNTFVRDVLKHNRRKLDTPLQVWRAVEKSGGAGSQRLAQWKHVKDRYRPSQEAVWVDDYLVRDAAAWLRKEEGICWVEHHAFADALAGVSGAPHFGAGDSGILTASGPVIASIGAHGTGKNLQQWSKNLIVCPPTAGAVWEQLLGRTHRMGQEEDTVTAEVYHHHKAFEEATEQAFCDAEYLEHSLGNKQRLLYCDTNIDRRRRP